jgi:dimethylsulfoniopropionate demethylase
VTPPILAVSPRVRATPWTSRVEAAGVRGYTVYNHTLLPTTFHGVEADYHHLRTAVQVWDVGCERQTELAGADAGTFAQLLTVRDLSRFDVGRCGYAPVCDADGRLLNDPVVLRVGEDRWWFSAADSDLALWAGGLAHGMGLDVRVCEADVWPLAVQGPQAEELVARVLGEEVRSIAFFRSAVVRYGDHPLVVSRTGWSAQGGFEIYVDDHDVGQALHDDLFRVGETLDVAAGCPNLIERIEAGLLSYGNDMTREHTALEAGLDRYCSLDAAIHAVGLEALRAERARGVQWRICGLEVDGTPLAPPREVWPVMAEDQLAGRMASLAWSPRLGVNVALAMLDTPHHAVGSRVTVLSPDGERAGTVVPLPFPGAVQR